MHEKPQKILIIFCGPKKNHWLTNIHRVGHTILSRIHEDCSSSRCKFQLKVEAQATNICQHSSFLFESFPKDNSFWVESFWFSVCKLTIGLLSTYYWVLVVLGVYEKNKMCSRFLELVVGLVLGTNISHYPSDGLGGVCNKQVN